MVKTYNDFNAVDHLSLNVKRGEIFGILGPNGAGKTTTLEIIETLKKPTVLGLISFLGFGFFMSGLASDENSAGPLVQLVSLPQMLLSGVFFSIDLLPKWIQPVANNLPLSYFNQSIRIVTIESGTLVDAFPYLVGFIAWGVVMYLLSIKTFKWE